MVQGALGQQVWPVPGALSLKCEYVCVQALLGQFGAVRITKGRQLITQEYSTCVLVLCSKIVFFFCLFCCFYKSSLFLLGLTLVSAPHLARSYHHLFPLDAFREVPTAEYEGEK